MATKLPRNTRKQKSKNFAQKGRRRTKRFSYTNADKPQRGRSLASEIYWAAIEILEDNGTHYRIRWDGTDPATGSPYEPTWELHEFVTPDLEEKWKETIAAQSAVAGHTESHGEANYLARLRRASSKPRAPVQSPKESVLQTRQDPLVAHARTSMGKELFPSALFATKNDLHVSSLDEMRNEPSVTSPQPTMIVRSKSTGEQIFVDHIPTHLPKSKSGGEAQLLSAEDQTKRAPHILDQLSPPKNDGGKRPSPSGSYEHVQFQGATPVRKAQGCIQGSVHTTLDDPTAPTSPNKFNSVERVNTTELMRTNVQVEAEKKRKLMNPTKTGCETCRKRKKKCHEATPKCKTCERGGFDCNSDVNTKLRPDNMVANPLLFLQAPTQVPIVTSKHNSRFHGSDLPHLLKNEPEIDSSRGPHPSIRSAGGLPPVRYLQPLPASTLGDNRNVSHKYYQLVHFALAPRPRKTES
jgi:hypothetical protein